VRTASRRARRLGGLVLLAATVWWAFLRRRAGGVRWVEPPASLPPGAVPLAGGRLAGGRPEPGAPGELPEGVLATDAGLTELPDEAAETVDEARVAELLAESPDAEVVVVDETAYEEAMAQAAPEPTAAGEATDSELDTGAVAASPTDLAAAAAAAEPAAAEEAAPDRPAAAGERTDVLSPGPAGELAGAESAGGSGSDAAGADAVDGPTERELRAPEIDESTMSIAGDAAVDEETGAGIAMPSFSEAPTMELPAVTDNLRAVRGIGPSMERKLHGLGIVSFRQLAMLDGAELERVRAELTDFRSRIEREDWVGQARALHREKYGRDPS
jgi:predicted flap endonuclease-1-like 5' DNA nuclease